MNERDKIFLNKLNPPPPICSCMQGYQQSWRFINPTSTWRFMSSWKSPQNVVQGHLVTFGLRVKTQMEKHTFMLLDTAIVYKKGIYGNTTKNHTMDCFVELTHQCKSCIQELSKTLVYEMNAQCSHWAMKTWWRAPPRGNGMLGDQWSWRSIDLTSGCQVMSSLKSHENSI